MASTAQATRNTITLKGSAVIVSEYFQHAVNSILFQRGIYPPDMFASKKYRNTSVMVTKDKLLSQYLTSVTGQMTHWLEKAMLQRLVLVVTDTLSREVVERWTFEVETNKEAGEGGEPVEKSDKDITAEIGAVIRQITASITFLPLLENPCTFDLLVYTDKSSDVPTEWEESDPRYITNGQDVKMRSFTTKVHKVDTSVAYKLAAPAEEAA